MSDNIACVCCGGDDYRLYRYTQGIIPLCDKCATAIPFCDLETKKELRLRAVAIEVFNVEKVDIE